MSTLHVICDVAGARYAIPADEVLQMEAFEGATPVPGAAPYVIGLMQSRQDIIPVLDVRTRFGLPAIEPTLGSRVVVLKLGARVVGLAVDSAREIRDIAPERFRPPPDVIATQSAGFVKSVAELEERIIMLLDASKLIGEEAVHA